MRFILIILLLINLLEAQKRPQLVRCELPCVKKCKSITEQARPICIKHKGKEECKCLVNNL
ncbi:unnamed protein product [Cylicocyclus nassatus]|uniref:Uncharacterized protein n=1 Tax=Cylicocyclus nassatus TaxID=53992 RepID=A0AA36M3Z6_CYLNA|nr:unnamed protein product [Cylicocyclus nassatus]